MNKACLFLIPTTLGDSNPTDVFPQIVTDVVKRTTYFIVENEKTARRFIKLVCPEKKQSELVIFQLDKHDKSAYLNEFIQPLLQGNDVGLLSEAGLPAIADPGSLVVSLAHNNKLCIKPLVGPSSLLLALMASGLNGQNFAFHGYLPKDTNELKRKIKFFEQISIKDNSAHLFIETPYRNNRLLMSLLKYLNKNTRLTIATDLTLTTEFIATLPVSKWMNNLPDLHKRPTVFIFQA